MADQFSISSGAAGILSLGIEVTKALVQYCTAYKDQDTDVARMSERLGFLLGLFQTLNSAMHGREFQADEHEILQKIEELIQKCYKVIKDLQDESQRLDKTATKEIKDKIKVLGRRLAYPFQREALLKLEKYGTEIRDNLSIALDILQLEDGRRAQEAISKLKSLQLDIMTRQWLNAPDSHCQPPRCMSQALHRDRAVVC
jgi:hypothetical protein